MATIAVFLALGGGALAATGGLVASDGAIHGCVGKGGSLTVVKPGKSCGNGLTAIRWPGKPDAPAGPAGGDLTGRYPSPKIANPAFAAEPTHLVVTPAQPVVCDVNNTRSGAFCSDPGSAKGWQNYEVDYAPVGYWRDKTGVVHLQGLATPFAAGGPSTIFVLPSGYRPKNDVREFTVRECGGVLGYVDINSDGNVFASDTNHCVPLDGITFRP
jgi:hypothetical protein